VIDSQKIAASPKFFLCLALVLSGITLNVLMAWSCILWSPSSHSHYPLEGDKSELTVGPNGIRNWWLTNQGFGVWETRALGSKNFEVFTLRMNDYTPVFFRGGWPMFSMQSVVTGVPPPGTNPMNYDDYLRKWKLPVGEILHRGLQTSKLPAWLHAQENRRLPAIPMWFGFVGNTLFYSLALSGLLSVWKKVSKSRTTNSSSVSRS
jgi:hypothetical protein